MLLYRSSPIQSSNLEWQYPAFWLPPYGYGIVLIGSLVALADFVAQDAAGGLDSVLRLRRGVAAGGAEYDSDGAGRLGAAGHVTCRCARARFRGSAEFAAAAALLLAIASAVKDGNAFQLRAAEWMLPKGAADFLKAHNVTGRMFNTYENGGYLVWRLWPARARFHRPARPERGSVRGLQPHSLLRGFGWRQERRRAAQQIRHRGAGAGRVRPLLGKGAHAGGGAFRSQRRRNGS